MLKTFHIIQMSQIHLLIIFLILIFLSRHEKPQANKDLCRENSKLRCESRTTTFKVKPSSNK